MPTATCHPDAALLKRFETITDMLLRAETMAASLCGSASSEREWAGAEAIIETIARALAELRLIMTRGAVSLIIDRARTL